MESNVSTGPAAGRPSPPVPPVDQDRKNRPGYPKERAPQAWPNARPEPRHMAGRSSVPLHGRPGKHMPPVFSTAVPLHGISGLVRRAAYRLPDHVTSHWTLLLLGDRIDSLSLRARRLLKLAVPAALVGLVARQVLRRA